MPSSTAPLTDDNGGIAIEWLTRKNMKTAQP
jgi:hypothetical protein